MKVGSSDRIETIYRMGDVGLKFSHVPRPSLPQALPRDKGLTYFQVNREQQQTEWQSVERSLTLAIRFNEKMIVGNIDRQEIVNLRLATEMPFRFSLFLLGAGAATESRNP
jgi:type VI secretion system protein ImpJ